jgi:hypothetical protein
VLALSTGDSAVDQESARDLEACLPLQLSIDGVPVVAPEKLMTLEAQTNGVYDRQSARALGLAVGARWVLYGNFAGGVANLYVVEVVDDRSIYADSARVDDAHARCTSFAAAAAARLKAEPTPR